MENNEFVNKLRALVPAGTEVNLNPFVTGKVIKATVSNPDGGLDDEIRVEAVERKIGIIRITGYADTDPNLLRDFSPEDISSGFEEIVKTVKAAKDKKKAEPTKELYIVTETVQDYKGASTNCYGATESLDKAREMLLQSIDERFDIDDRFSYEDDPKQAAKAFLEDNFKNKEKTFWNYFDGDTDYTFEIHKTKLS